MSVDATAMGDAMQNALIANGADALETMSLSVDNLKAKFSEGISNLFKDVAPAVRPFMEAIKGIVDLFDQASASGQVMRAVITPVFSALFAVATQVVDAIHGGISMIV